jgi:hypothetical protein
LFSDKGVIYEDMNIQLGFIRSISMEWRQATLRVFVGNKSDSQPITNFLLSSNNQFVTIKADESSQAPGEVGPKQQIEVKVFVSALLKDTPTMTLSYE